MIFEAAGAALLTLDCEFVHKPLRTLRMDMIWSVDAAFNRETNCGTAPADIQYNTQHENLHFGNLIIKD